jgi:drug/metabolite transporter (DMT)-like permease
MFIITAYFVSRFYLGEQITRVKIFAMIFAFIGLSFVFGGAILAFAPLGLLLAALNGVASGGEMAFSKKPEAKYSAALIVFIGWVATFLTHLPISLLIGESQIMPEFNMAWFWLMAYSIVNALAFLLAVVGFRLVDASVASLIGLSEIIFAVLFGALIFHEKLSLSIGIGGAIILFAAMLPDAVGIWKKRRHKSEQMVQ